jgi:hypothetical protein
MEELIQQGDLDGLIRLVDALCDRREWPTLDELGDRCRRAHERGHQLWPIASLVDYRLALHAPGEWAAKAVRDGAAHLGMGPISEVVASTHSWRELEPHLAPGGTRSLVAFERVARGENLAHEVGVDPAIFEIPLALQPWEPVYPASDYRDDGADHPTPDAPRLAPLELAEPGDPVDDADAEHALRELVRPWLTQSNGRATIVCVEGDLRSAIARAAKGGVDWAVVDPATALAWMAWAGASGGAHGRRRGMATGRFNAWWAAAVLGGLDDAWSPDELGDELGRLDWALWRPNFAPGGWQLGIAASDADERLAWAMWASDLA